jgi:UDP-N-acetylglucosamine/UDP-N-acetylgalactosamine diphosphorylase
LRVVDFAYASVSDIGLPSRKSLFQLQAERILRLRALAAAAAGKGSTQLNDVTPSVWLFLSSSSASWLLCHVLADAKSVSIPWYIMTSDHTHVESIDYFKENNHFGLPAADVFFFEQVHSDVAAAAHVSMNRPSCPR